MILHLQGWQSHYGATHRKNLDTPPLKGWCVERGKVPVGTLLQNHWLTAK